MDVGLECWKGCQGSAWSLPVGAACPGSALAAGGVEIRTQMESVAHGCRPHAVGMMDVLGHLPTQLLRHGSVGKNSEHCLEPRRPLLLGGDQEHLHPSSSRKDV